MKISVKTVGAMAGGFRSRWGIILQSAIWRLALQYRTGKHKSMEESRMDAAFLWEAG
ncbi:hypothetical protein [Paenibacillus sp. 1-18]|uniref:hypothetical protein n=1 Tax=Paenibacillus sp. 1-18 TaxID=1333846 RepID=UPI0004BBE22C|nr:hypothetical protein [Paenibacillus sp. 1-18]